MRTLKPAFGRRIIAQFHKMTTDKVGHMQIVRVQFFRLVKIGAGPVGLPDPIQAHPIPQGDISIQTGSTPCFWHTTTWLLWLVLVTGIALLAAQSVILTQIIRIFEIGRLRFISLLKPVTRSVSGRRSSAARPANRPRGPSAHPLPPARPWCETMTTASKTLPSLRGFFQYRSVANRQYPLISAISVIAITALAGTCMLKSTAE